MPDLVMALLVFAGVAGLVMALAVSTSRRASRDVGRPARPSPSGRRIVDLDGCLRVELGVRVQDPELPAAKRLIDRAARAHLDRPDVRVVEVVDLDGRVVGRRFTRRPVPAPSEVDPSIPETAAPVPAASLEEAAAASIALGPVSTGTTSLTDRLELPPGFGGDLDDHPSVGALVARLLDAGGAAATMRSGVIVVGEMAVVPIDAVEPTGRVSEAELDRAYLRFKESGARVGIAITDGQLPVRELERRHLLAPELRHGGIEALQRLSDEVALAGDVTAALRELTDTSGHASPIAG